MDDWGDPWADDNATKPASKEEVETRQNHSAAPVVLHGFEDEAQWGYTDIDDDFGDWSNPQNNPADPIRTHEASASLSSLEQIPLSTKPLYTEISEEPTVGDENSDEGRPINQVVSVIEGDTGGSTSVLDSDISDSGTTIHPDQTASELPDNQKAVTTTEDDVSIRSSTSPSDASRTEVHSESPRTSFEDDADSSKKVDLAVAPANHGIRGVDRVPDDEEVNHPQEPPAAAQDENVDEAGDFGGFGESDSVLVADEKTDRSSSTVSDAVEKGASSKTGRQTSENEPIEPLQEKDSTIVQSNATLLEQLFPPKAHRKDTPPAPDDPISTTSARKAWYRLTRKQTMREFNNGNDDDNHVRVNWSNSTVRREVSKIVDRWTTEDRIAGRAVLGGKAASAIFFWDQPAPAASQSPFKLSRNSSSLSRSIEPVSPTEKRKQSGSALSSITPVAQFSWSSAPLDADDPWRQDLSDSHSSSVQNGSHSVTLSNPVEMPVVTIDQAHGARSGSMDLSAKPLTHISHQRVPSTQERAAFQQAEKKHVHFMRSINDVVKTSSNAPPELPEHRTLTEPSSSSPATANPWTSLSPLDTGIHIPSQSSPASREPEGDNYDDDDWGEMVQSPVTPATPVTASSIVPIASSAKDRSDSPSPSIKPKQAIQAIASKATVSRHASPVVRLRGPISPTSSKQNFMSFLPPAAPSASPTTELTFSLQTTIPRKPSILPSTESPLGESHKPTTSAQPPPASLPDPDFSIFETPSISPNPPASSTPPNTDPSPPQPASLPHPNFSIFESPTQLPPPPGTLLSADLSIFDTPGSPPPKPLLTTQPPQIPQRRSSRAAATSPVAHQSRILGMNSSPTSAPASTSTSKFARRKEAEENVAFRKIVDGLPDLRYMLR